MSKILFILITIFLALSCESKSIVPKIVEGNSNLEKVDPNSRPTEEILASLKKMKELDAWSITNESPQVSDLNLKIDYNSPNRYRVKNKETEVLIFGNEVFVNEGEKWAKSDMDITDKIKQLDAMTTPEVVEGINKSAKYLGEDVIESVKTKKYSYNVKDSQNVVLTNSTLWISTETGLPIKNSVVAADVKQVATTTTTYTYKDIPKIEKPKIK